MQIESISPHFAWRDETFTVSSIPLEAIIGAIGGSSAYVYDAATLRDQYRRLRAVLPPRVEIYYAMKANPSLAVVSALFGEGAGIDVASMGELLACQALELDPSRLSFTGPVKTSADLALALELGVYTNIESAHEVDLLLDLLANRAGSQHPGDPLRLGVRINPPFAVTNAQLALSGGGSSKFGVDLDQVPALIERLAAHPMLQLDGLHFSTASGIRSSESLLDYWRQCLGVAADLSTKMPVDRIDLGGGLGIPYAADEAPLDLARLGAGLVDALDAVERRCPALREARLLIEPGRFLAGPCGLYLARVSHVKESGGRQVVLLDGGAHQLSGPSMRGTPNPTFNLSRRPASPARDATVYDVGGETCTSADFFGKSLPLTRVEAGDWIGVANAGAYGYTQSLLAFNSHGVPPELLILEGEIHRVRDPAPPADHLRLQHLPTALGREAAPASRSGAPGHGR